MDAHSTLILAAAGAVSQWLRGFPWFNNWETVAVAVVAATVMTVLGGHAQDAGTFFQAFGTDIQTVLASLGAGHLLSHMSAGKILPVNNQFAKP